MICAECDDEIPNAGVICERCNPPRPGDEPTLSHRQLALTVRRLKGLVMASIMFGILIAPFAVWIGTTALYRYSSSPTVDPADLRQLVLLRRIAIGLLLFWAVVLGGHASGWFAPAVAE